MKDVLRIGDTVQWRGCFGLDDPLPAVIDHMEVTDDPRCKYGVSVLEVPVEFVRENRVVFGLTNGQWCYSEQIVLPSHD